MDNFRVDITWEGETPFRTILEMVIKKQVGKVEYYAEDPDYGLVLFWSEPTMRLKPKARKRAMAVTAATNFAWNWLKTADYGGQPDHDGSNGKGWRIFNESWGHVGGEWSAICAVQPVWAMYGK